MTIQAQLSPLAPGRPSRGADRPTLGLDDRGADRPTGGLDTHPPKRVGALPLLDHRTRSRTIPLEAAPPGRYLSVEHEDAIHLIPLDRPIVHVGRGLSADVRIEDAHVSRRHAIVAQRGDGVRVLDDRSSNGTFLNGRQVTVAYLNDGDVLRLGRVVFRFVEIKPQLKRTPPVRCIPLAAGGRHPVLAGAI
jgi:Inner membrane component of T3SS, cytoplasmic domain